MRNKARIQAFIDRHPWWPVLVFAAVPAVLITLFYGAFMLHADPVPAFDWFVGVAGAVLFVLFLVYLGLFRREDRGSLGSSVPTILGPQAALWYVELKDPALWKVVEEAGGDVLVQLAFFLAGLLGLIIYYYSSIREIKGEGEQRNRVQIKVKIVSTVVIASLVAMAWAPNFAPHNVVGQPKMPTGPLLFGALESPYPTPLTVCRLLLALSSVLLATWPHARANED